MRTWAGNLQHSASTSVRPRTVRELADLLARIPTAKPVGTRHSSSELADTHGVPILLDRLPGQVEVDSVRRGARVPGHITYGQLALALEARGWALHNMASLPHISVAGAVDTATRQLDVRGPWHERLPHFGHESTPSAGDELQSNYLLPIGRASEALAAVRPLADGLAPLRLVSEIRTVASDRFWLSPAYRQDSIVLHFTWRSLQRKVQAFLPHLEAALAPFGARPHWAKLSALPAGELQALYPRFGEFHDLVAKRDREGKFAHPWIDRLFGRTT